MLDRFRQAKAGEIEELRRRADAGLLEQPCRAARPDFARALLNPANGCPIAVIAEYKRASPSKGLICDSVSVEEAAAQYAANGASALSILTEETWFKGHMSFVDLAALAALPPLPVLRKDFIFDPLQVQATAVSRASALLLIVRLTPDPGELRQLRELAESFGMQAVVEIFNLEDLKIARESGARIIQANARDLESLEVDRARCLKLIGQGCARDEIWIQASGASRPEHLLQAAEAGFHAILVGTSLMANGRPGAELSRLLGRQPDWRSHAG